MMMQLRHQTLKTLAFVIACGLLVAGFSSLLVHAQVLQGASLNTVSNQVAEASQNAWRAALPGYTYQFPRDHASHPEFKTEWWYYTGHLQADDGKRYGYELTFFRVGNHPPAEQSPVTPQAEASEPTSKPTDSPWKLNNVFLAHFAISDENAKTFTFQERWARGAFGKAFAQTERYHVKNHHWQVVFKDGAHYLTASMPAKSSNNTASAVPNTAIRLKLTSNKPPVIHGQNGVSQKADCVGCASHYYSFTRLKTSGNITINGKTMPVGGQSWMDHEFGSNQLTPEQVGWDWFSIQLDNDEELMIYQMRKKFGRIDRNSSATLVHADGTSEHLGVREFKIEPTDHWQSLQTVARYPMGWKIRLPRRNWELVVSPAFRNQELRTAGAAGGAYWEGSCRVVGKAGAQVVRGQAYVEMTGYAKVFDNAL